jgi:protein gp37
MAETTIEWTDATWNPVAGCTVLTAGCTNCYAMQMAKRLEAMGLEKYKGLARKSGKRSVWTGKLYLDHAALNQPFKWKKPRQIFVNSMSDMFHPDVPFDFVSKVWQVMEQTPRHQYQILTKRADRMAEFFTQTNPKILKNVWLGVSVENSDTVNRIEVLRRIPSVVRFISFEPLIGSVERTDLSDIHWAIVGGESGPGARPIKEQWIDEIHQSCKIYKTAFFFKQWGAWGEDNKKRSKKLNGRLYRGQEWNDMPVATF